MPAHLHHGSPITTLPLRNHPNMKTLDVKILDARLKDNLPAYATPGSAGLDLRACIEAAITLAPGETKLISTGIAIHVADPGYAALVLPRMLWIKDRTVSVETARKMRTLWSNAQNWIAASSESASANAISRIMRSMPVGRRSARRANVVTSNTSLGDACPEPALT